MRYTFVLTPSSDQALKYVEASQKTFCQYEPIYLLNTKGTSSPHITIIQFECDSFDFPENNLFVMGKLKRALMRLQLLEKND